MIINKKRFKKILTNGYKQKQMHINRGSIGGLIGVRVVGIVKWGYQDNFKPVNYFFYEKISRPQKHSQANINQQNRITQTLNNKGNNFSSAQTSKRVKVACFAFWCILCARNHFVKKNKQAWNCPDNVILLYY